MDYVVVDIETTGLTPEINEIIEIGAVKVQRQGKNLKITKRYAQLIKPYHEIPPIVRNLTGIDNDMLKDSPRFPEVVDDFLKFLGDAVFVAHNAIFDLKMLNECLKRSELPLLKNNYIDTQDLVAIAYPTLSSHRLGDIVDSLNIKTGDLHRALADADATAKVLIKTLGKFEKLPAAVLMQINKLTANLDTPLKDIFAEICRSKLSSIAPEELKELGNWKSAILPKKKFKKSAYSKEREDEEKIPAELIDDYFSAEGKMKEIFPSYEFRPQQTKMAKVILNCFNNNEHLLIEAGTGTGKSAAYLLPLLLWIQHNGGPLIVSTRTKNLQAQLIDKDIPAILKLFPKHKFQILLLKGRQNYICLRRFEMLLQQMILSRSKEMIKLLPIFTWLLETEDGDLSELHSSIEKRFGRQLNSESSVCIGEKCHVFRHCFLQFMRRQAKYADLIIANHALVFTDLAGDIKILPEYKKIVLDEAHTIEDAATDSYSLSVGYNLCLEEFKKCDLFISNNEYNNLSEQLRAGLREYFSLLSEVASKKKLRHQESEQKILISDLKQDNNLWQALDLIRLNITKDLKRLFPLIDQVIENQEEEGKIVELKTIRFVLEKLWTEVNHICEGIPNYTSWVLTTSGKEPYNVLLQASPIDVGEILQENLFASKESVIMTSATLMVNDNFNYFKQRFGIDRNLEQKFVFESVGSPYNYQQKMLCAIPDDLLPLSSETQYILNVAEYLAEVFEVMNGRTLVLFTSYRMLEQTYKLVKHLTDDLGLSILCQGMHGSRRALLSRFKNNKRTILFGTSSFWEGVDIQGEALSCVVIVKLPFSVPTEPIIKARSEFVENNGKNAFYDYSVPQAVIRFKQGIGRLIRSHQDQGVVMIIDERIFSKNYGRMFMQALPGCEVYKGPQNEVLKKMRSFTAAGNVSLKA